ncbi:hypothetical protein [Falsihalocynthiibacter arcticus]|uniref:hypothetical protein n=1 Tax=Falsihalocynthiibacter arcticus TaxID=1579316 RepID=UPI0012E920E4|nr:hypothetical protein [Falsihalocynthiibacter arcticus]
MAASSQRILTDLTVGAAGQGWVEMKLEYTDTLSHKKISQFRSVANVISGAFGAVTRLAYITQGRVEKWFTNLVRTSPAKT